MATISPCSPQSCKSRRLPWCSARCPPGKPQCCYRAVTEQNHRSQGWNTFLFYFVFQLCFMGIYMYLDMSLILLLFMTMAAKQKHTSFSFTVRVQDRWTHRKLKILIFLKKRMLSSLMYQHMLLERDTHISFPEANKEKKHHCMAEMLDVKPVHICNMRDALRKTDFSYAIYLFFLQAPKNTNKTRPLLHKSILCLLSVST